MASFEFDKIGYWSEVKLDIIKDYAKAYSTILVKQPWCKGHFYIDAFAGAGEHISKTTGEAIAGSPINAINTDPPFKHYYLIDLNSGKTEHLQQVTKDVPNVTIRQGDCNEVLLKEVFPLLSKAHGHSCPLPPRPVWLASKLGGNQTGWRTWHRGNILELSRRRYQPEHALERTR